MSLNKIFQITYQSNKPSLNRIHFNKQKQMWSVHSGGKCHMVSHLVIKTQIESEEKPERKSNPRYFFKTIGVLTIFENGNAVIE